MTPRADYEVILRSVPEGARVLDVGCGDGELLERLKRERRAVVRGMELSQAGVNACVARGLSVVQGDADFDLKLYPDGEFDVVILSQTIQATRKPAAVLAELRRIARVAVVSLPNFGHWRVRLGLLTRGRMPVTPQLPMSWHETENLHLCTLLDFEALALATGWKIDAVVPVSGGHAGAPAGRATGLANWLAEEGVFSLVRA
jgi:methionine biosynthesis protein MetW